MFMPNSDTTGIGSTGTEIAVMTSLANKTALVTGASRGMGRAAALALAAAGARVIVHYGRNAEQAKAVVDQIRADGGRADALAADLAAPDGPHALAAEVRKLTGNRLDVLVSNAGISNAAPFENGQGFRQLVRGQRPRALFPAAATHAHP
jgi:NAD(P)-dependent dehydrogenase (short-subunit alcohol dehydrogenase family)